MHARLFAPSTVRTRSKVLWAGLLRITGLLPLAKTWVRRRGALVLTFHRVLADAELEGTASLPGMIVRAKTFEAFLRDAAQRFAFIDFSRGPDWQSRSRLKLGVTFDDGWSDSASIAFPLARRQQAPMLIFIVPEKTGVAFPFWPERAVSLLRQRSLPRGGGESIRSMESEIENLKQMTAEERGRKLSGLAAAKQSSGPQTQHPPVDTTMTWAQIAELQAAGVSFGSHSSTHEILTSIPLGQAEEEIAGSRRRIEQKLGAPCRLFAYPNGDVSPQVRELAQYAGYSFAFINQGPGIWTPDGDPYLVPRVNVCEGHLVDARGNFSPLVFDYAVIWGAAKGLLAQKIARVRAKLRRK